MCVSAEQQQINMDKSKQNRTIFDGDDNKLARLHIQLLQQHSAIIADDDDRS